MFLLLFESRSGIVVLKDAGHGVSLRRRESQKFLAGPCFPGLILISIDPVCKSAGRRKEERKKRKKGKKEGYSTYIHTWEAGGIESAKAIPLWSRTWRGCWQRRREIGEGDLLIRDKEKMEGREEDGVFVQV